MTALPAEDGRPSHGSDCCTELAAAAVRTAWALLRHWREIPAVWRESRRTR